MLRYRMLTTGIWAIAAFALLLLDCPARAAEASVLDGRTLDLAWTIPFAGLLLSIALVPLFAPQFWHHHHGKISAAWVIAFLLPFAIRVGLSNALAEVVHILFLEYVPFIIVLFALFTVAGGVRIVGRLSGSAASNTAVLAFGTFLASIVGTTGASVLLIRPLISANRARSRNAHVFVFFIFLVSNIGGALSPLGDPPLFLGFLAGVSFFWPTIHLLEPTLILSAVLLVAFYVLDKFLRRREPPNGRRGGTGSIRLEGKRNLALLAGVVATVLMSGVWHPDIHINILGTRLELEEILRDIVLVALALVSLRITRRTIHEANSFSWFPILEVAKLFAGLFLTIAPAIAILRAGADGALAAWIALVTGPNGEPIPAMYFWLTGLLSSALDNAPTYLMFFNTAGGDPGHLMGPLSQTLAAISAGAVFMGENSYVGNAPNFMVKSICEQHGIRMPSFFSYAIWAFGILTPLYLLLTDLFFSA